MLTVADTAPCHTPSEIGDFYGNGAYGYGYGGEDGAKIIAMLSNIFGGDQSVGAVRVFVAVNATDRQDAAFFFFDANDCNTGGFGPLPLSDIDQFLIDLGLPIPKFPDEGSSA